MIYEWDPAKAKFNLSNHGVSFEESSTIFGDPLSLTIHDAQHSQTEDRFVTVGLSAQLNLLVVVFADRGAKIRIISARHATKQERKEYEEGL